MKVRSKPRSPHQATRSSNSSSLTPFSATALILTPSPASFAASSPSITWSKLAPARDRAEFFGIERIERDVDALDAAIGKLAAKRLSWLPLVVTVSSSRSPALRWRDRPRNSDMMLRRTSGSPPVRRSFRTPRPTKALHTRSSSSSVKRSCLRQEGHVLRHAIDAAEIAAVRHRNPEIGDSAPKRIDKLLALHRWKIPPALTVCRGLFIYSPVPQLPA